MVSTFQALGVFLLAMLPGALYVWAFERQAGGWGLGLSDRLLRFVGTSAILQVLIAPLTYLIYRDYGSDGPHCTGRDTTALVVVGSDRLRSATDRLRSARWPSHTPTQAVGSERDWSIASAESLGPSLRNRRPRRLGKASIEGRRWLASRRLCALRCHQGDLRSYAAGYPETQDLYLVETAECDPATGAFVVDAHGAPKLRGISVLVRWDQVAYLESIRT